MIGNPRRYAGHAAELAGWLLRLSGSFGEGDVPAAILTSMRLDRLQRTRPTSPVRVLLAALLLAGFGLWQAWTCSAGMAASPVLGMPRLSTAVAAMPAGSPGDGGLTAAMPSHDDQMPAGMAGACVTVLASIAIAFLLLACPPRLLALLRRMAAVVWLPVTAAVDGPSLTRLCISRT